MISPPRPALMSTKQRRALPSRAQRVMVQARYTELCNRYPGPAAFVDGGGRVLDMNDDAPPLLDALEELPGGLRGLATAIGAYPRFDAMETGTGVVKRLEVALIPLADGVLVLARDRSLTDNLNEALAESRKRYKDLVDISSDFAWEVDADGVFVFVSPRGALGYAVRDLIGQRAVDILPVADSEPDAASSSSPFMVRERVEDAQVWMKAANGELALVSISSMPLFDAAGRWSGTRGVARDITEANLRETELADNETRDRLLAHVLRMLVDADDADSGLAAALRACVRALGAAGGALWRRGQDGLAVAVTCGAPVPETFVVGLRDEAADAGPTPRHDGGGAHLRMSTVFRHRVNGLLGIWRGDGEPPWQDRDATLFGRIAAQFGLALAQLDGQQELERQARTDPLTGLLNRRAFVEEMRIRLGAARRTARSAALVYVDVDNFKPVNDVHGHAMGDAVLRRIADRLRRSVRASDLVARLGGDEFAVWLDEADADGARQKGRELLKMKADFAEFSGAPDRPIGFSIGIAVVDPAAAESVDELIERADAAMYGAKHGGKGRAVVSGTAGRP
jgi:diguanylate cyclase (GGDEF)-like protein/PAS domain S-box-containing protein